MTSTASSDSTNTLSPGLPPRDSEAANANDVCRFVYTWFTLFEHRAPAERLAAYLAPSDLTMAFPGTEPIRDSRQFTAWYEQLVADTLWNFHEVANLQVKPAGDGAFDVAFDVDWQGAAAEGSALPTNLPEGRFRFALRQWWRVVVRPGGALDSPFSIADVVTETR